MREVRKIEGIIDARGEVVSHGNIYGKPALIDF